MSEKIKTADDTWQLSDDEKSVTTAAAQAPRPEITILHPDNPVAATASACWLLRVHPFLYRFCAECTLREYYELC